MDGPRRHHRRGQEHCPGHKTAGFQVLAQLAAGCVVCLMWGANRLRYSLRMGKAFTFSSSFLTQNLLSGVVSFEEPYLEEPGVEAHTAIPEFREVKKLRQEDLDCIEFEAHLCSERLCQTNPLSKLCWNPNPQGDTSGRSDLQQVSGSGEQAKRTNVLLAWYTKHFFPTLCM